MTAYTLLGKPETAKQHLIRKYWRHITAAFVIITIISTTVIIYYVKNDIQLESDNEVIGLPERYINFSLPTQSEPFCLDLNKYPIEDNILQVFPLARNDIQKATEHRLLKQHNKVLNNVSWAQTWLIKPSDTNLDLSCNQLPLPYPILRHMAKDYFPVNDADDFYEDTDIPFLSQNKPFVLLPYYDDDNKPLLDIDLCIRVIVPFQNVGGDDPIHQSLYRPYPKNNADLTSPWWDTFLMHLTDPTTNTTNSIQLEPWRGHHTLRQQARKLRNISPGLPEWAKLREDEIYERPRTHIYEANVRLTKGWQLSCLLEFVEARYNFEYGPVTPYQPINLPIFPAIINQVGDTHDSINKNIDLLDELKHHLSLPLCKGFDHPGRWLRFPTFPHQHFLVNNSLAELKSQLLGLTRDNTYWAPYDCHYRHISYEQFNRCAAQKYPRGLNLFGDSNIRRSIKKFLSQGHWCQGWEKHLKGPLIEDNQRPTIIDSFSTTPSIERRQLVNDPNQYESPQEYRFSIDEQTRSCFCEDYSEPYWDKRWFDPVVRRFDMVYRNSERQTRLLGVTEWDTTNNSQKGAIINDDSWRVSSYKWDGLTFLNSPNWDTAVPSSPANADIAIFSLNNWDAAFGELEPYLRDLDHLIYQIKQHYDKGTRIIYRTGQYYCCRVDHSDRTRQVSGPRMDVFEKLTQQKFVQELNADIWNTYRLGEAKSWEEKIVAIGCPSNHVPADQVEIENQVLMNGLCNL
ncbi:uncharacterized protein BX663DRAFT_522002 [Cokeromyces recurvatus]|uniref:uncharacterized protein n=1 Tax=Cokeromyces recurvatus TaxID=90255 RepID=UPI002220F072|nr:uncharacterized protein BX663DRAFT_522002 [Cokeromyces recurvatus]KAI7899261.1 hypothetical protein BX663DRAFT_522002 [Cokeromyces recurvatus]